MLVRLGTEIGGEGGVGTGSTGVSGRYLLGDRIAGGIGSCIVSTGMGDFWFR